MDNTPAAIIIFGVLGFAMDFVKEEDRGDDIHLAYDANCMSKNQFTLGVRLV